MKIVKNKFSIILLISIIVSVIILIYPNNEKIEKNEKKEQSGNEDFFSSTKIIPNGIGINVFGNPSEKEVKLMSEAGVKWVRIDLVWSNIEQSKGIYNFRDTGYDQFIGLLSKYNIQPYLILDYSNNLYENEMSVTTNEGRHAFAEFAKVAAKRYKNLGAIWEVWNEPNLPHYWETTPSYTDYTLLVSSVAPVINEFDPSGVVIGPAISGVRGDSLTWLEETFKLGLLDYIDAISVHPYRKFEPETVANDYDTIQSLIEDYSDKKLPIISGEWGYFVENIPNTYAEEIRQAQNLTRMLLVNYWKGVPVSILYEWKNSGEDPNYMHDNYGIMKDANTPKLSYDAIKTFSTTLNGYFYSERMETESRNDYILKFTNLEGEEILVLWTTGSEHIIDYSYPSGTGELIGMLGDVNSFNWNNKMSIKLTKSPSYLLIN